MKKVTAVIHKNGRILGQGQNLQHKFCLRRLLRISSGKHYWLCAKCHPENHAEIQAIIWAQGNIKGSVMDVNGHSHACKYCKEVAKYEGVKINIIKSDE